MSEKLLENECKHVPCRCPVIADGEFCSSWCKKSFGSTDCGCGHVDCRAEACKEL